MEILIISLFFVVVLVLILLGIWGSHKEKVKRNAINFERDRIIHLTKNDRLEMMIKLGLFINFLKEFTKNYDPKKGIISLGEINRYGSELINEISHSEQLKIIFKDSIRKEELKEHIESLTKVKPSNWESQAHESFNILNAKINFILENEEYKDFVKEIIEKNDLKYYLVKDFDEDITKKISKESNEKDLDNKIKLNSKKIEEEKI